MVQFVSFCHEARRPAVSFAFLPSDVACRHHRPPHPPGAPACPHRRSLAAPSPVEPRGASPWSPWGWPRRRSPRRVARWRSPPCRSASARAEAAKKYALTVTVQQQHDQRGQPHAASRFAEGEALSGPSPPDDVTIGTVNGGSAPTLTFYVTRQSNGVNSARSTINFTTPATSPHTGTYTNARRPSPRLGPVLTALVPLDLCPACPLLTQDVVEHCVGAAVAQHGAEALDALLGEAVGLRARGVRRRCRGRRTP